MGIGEKGEARPLAEWRAAFAAVAEEIAAADDAIREARLRQREIDRELARLEAAAQGQSAAQDGSAHRSRRRRAGPFGVARQLHGARRALGAAL